MIKAHIHIKNGICAIPIKNVLALKCFTNLTSIFSILTKVKFFVINILCWKIYNCILCWVWIIYCMRWYLPSRLPPMPALATCPPGVPADADRPPWAAFPVNRPPKPASAWYPPKFTPILPSWNEINCKTIKKLN